MKKSHKIGLAIAGLLAIASWVIALYFWNKLPGIIPTHFGFNGMPDDWNPKSIWYSFLLPALQLFMVVLFIFLYYKPQYTNMPTTLWLMTLEKHKREHAFNLLRVVLVGTSLWIGVLLTYMTYAMNVSALNTKLGMNPWLLLGIVGAMILWLIYWTLKMYHVTKAYMKESDQKK